MSSLPNTSELLDYPVTWNGTQNSAFSAKIIPRSIVYWLFFFFSACRIGSTPIVPILVHSPCELVFRISVNYFHMDLTYSCRSCGTALHHRRCRRDCIWKNICVFVNFEELSEFRARGGELQKPPSRSFIAHLSHILLVTFRSDNSLISPQ